MPASSLLLLCTVLSVADGDTLKARCNDEATPLVIRLAEIDAPEKGQPFGRASKAALSALCLGKAAEVRPRTKDRWGRTVARVSCGGVDASSAQVQSGLAWAFTKYLTDSSIAELEKQARAEGGGLWAQPTPVPPWTWRRDHPHPGQPHPGAAPASSATTLPR